MNVLIRQGFLSARGNASKQLYACYSTSICDKEKIESLVKGKKVVVFMKGNPAVPQCGFSKAVVQIFDFHGVNNYDTHNVLDDECIREGVKAYSNWPTIPQVFMGGQFIGGCDILLELHQNGDLINELNKVGIRSTLLDEPDKKA